MPLKFCSPTAKVHRGRKSKAVRASLFRSPMSREIRLQLPAPHLGQERVIQQAKRFNVVCCGRRWGKTVLGMNRLIYQALKGKPVAWFAPNYRLLSDVWRELQRTLQPILARPNQQERRLELRGGGVIEM